MTYRILVVDPDPGRIERSLSAAGYEVVVATDPVRALQMFQRVRPDLAMIDSSMAEAPGPELGPVLKRTEQGRKTPIVVVADAEARYTEAGYDQRLAKPVEDEALLALCNKLLAGQPRQQTKQVSAPSAPGNSLLDGSELMNALEQLDSIFVEAPETPAEPHDAPAATQDTAASDLSASLEAVFDEPVTESTVYIDSPPLPDPQIVEAQFEAQLQQAEPPTQPSTAATADTGQDIEAHLDSLFAGQPADRPPVDEEPASTEIDEELVVGHAEPDAAEDRPAPTVEPDQVTEQTRFIDMDDELPEPESAELKPDDGAAAEPGDGAETRRAMPRWPWLVAAAVLVVVGAAALAFVLRGPQVSAPAPPSRPPTDRIPASASATTAGTGTATAETAGGTDDTRVVPLTTRDGAEVKSPPEPSAAPPESRSTRKTSAREQVVEPLAVAPSLDSTPTASSPGLDPTPPATAREELRAGQPTGSVDEATPPAAASPISEPAPMPIAGPKAREAEESVASNIPETATAVEPPVSEETLPATPMDAPARVGDSLTSATPTAPKPRAVHRDPPPDTAGLGFSPPVLMRRIEPSVSPRATKRLRKSQTVVLSVLVDELGRVTRVVVDQGIPGSELEAAAITSVLSWNYRPASEAGRPVKAWATARITFTAR